MAISPDYQFQPHERPFMPGSPATPDHPTVRRVGYFAIGTLLGLTGGFINGLLLANLPQIQGALGLTSVEGGWLTAAYSMTNVCMSLLMIKFRQQFGIQRFTRTILPLFLIVNAAQLFVHSYGFELMLRGISGVVASGLSTLALFYIMQSMPAAARLGGLVIGVGISQIALPLARMISPMLFDQGDIGNLFLFEFGLTLLCLSGVWTLRLPPGDRIAAFEPLDFVTFAVLAPGVGLLCAVLVQGRIQWWSTEWLGYALAAAVALISTGTLIEHNRANPLLNTRWIGTAAVLRFVVVAAVMRLLLSEQSFGANGLLTVAGMGQDQLIPFYAVITAATAAGLIASLLTLNPQDLLLPVMASCLMIAVAAYIDSDASNLTRPAQLYLTQAMIAFAAIYFLGPTMIFGLLKALAKGPSHIVSFSAVFGIAQQLGGLGGASLLGTYQVMRERFHSDALVQAIVPTDPQIAFRLQQLAGSQARVLADPALRNAEGGVFLAQQVSREANILAFNDVFTLVAVLAAAAFGWLLARWSYYNWRGINPLANELAAMAALRGKAAT